MVPGEISAKPSVVLRMITLWRVMPASVTSPKKSSMSNKTLLFATLIQPLLTGTVQDKAGQRLTSLEAGVKVIRLLGDTSNRLTPGRSAGRVIAGIVT